MDTDEHTLTYISHLINLLEARLQEGLEGNAVKENHRIVC